MKILITEDDSIARRVLQLFLEPFGEVDSAGNGADALLLFTKAYQSGTPYELVCLDIGLPDLPGLEVLRQIREFEQQHNVTQQAVKATPRAGAAIIMLTGMSDEAHIEAARQLGASEYLLKPVKESDLIKLLRQLGLVNKE